MLHATSSICHHLCHRVAYFSLHPFHFGLAQRLPDEQVEKKFWESNPALGGYINWMIVGSALNASKVAPASLPGKARTLGEWSLDNLPHKMELLKQYLNAAYPAGARIDGGFTSSSSSRVVGSSGSNVSTVIYIHCEAGTDRTGEVSGSYYMKWQNKSYPEVRASCAMGAGAATPYL